MFSRNRFDSSDYRPHFSRNNGNTIPEHQRMRQVIDVFTGAREVDKFACSGQAGIRCNRILEIILNRLYVMIRGLFNILDLRRTV